jgi:hypothetical protein
MANHFDRILRDAIKEVFLSVLSGKRFPLHRSIQDLTGKLHTTLDFETDFAALLDAKDDEKARIMHLEIQYNKEENIGRRMMEYYVFLRRKWRFPVEQLAVFLHNKDHNASGRRIFSSDEKINFYYDVLYLQDVPYEKLLAIDKPEAVMLAILGGFGDTPPETVIDQTIQRLISLDAHADRLGTYFLQLETLSKIRNLQSIVEPKIKTMTSIYQAILKDYPASPDDPVVKLLLGESLEKLKAEAQAQGEAKGEARGEARGKAEGKAEGIAEGQAKGKAEFVAKFLRAGKLTPAEIAETLGMPIAQMLAIRDGASEG